MVYVLALESYCAHNPLNHLLVFVFNLFWFCTLYNNRNDNSINLTTRKQINIFLKMSKYSVNVASKELWTTIYMTAFDQSKLHQSTYKAFLYFSEEMFFFWPTS